jgi:phosphoribosylformylglycinamidine synthase
VGDPFEEKRLIEACLELLERGLAVGVQDLGAAGLSCAASETAAKAGMGMDVDAARVARREPGMSAVEVLTSESQERMLAIVEPRHLDDVLELARRWEVRAGVVGRVTDSGRFRVYEGVFDAWGVPGEQPDPPPGDAQIVASSDREPLADVPVGSLGDGPVYHRPIARPADHAARTGADPAAELVRRFRPGTDLSAELLGLLASPSVADTTWVSRQYDHQLFLNTVVGPGGDAAVLRLKGTRKALALSTDGAARFCALDPRTGGRLTVLEAARNVACTGARPLALVNCLNFGNPEHPEVMWQLAEVVEGMSEACEALGIPVVGGNVSFYNESRGADIDPTPVVGVLGLIDALDDPPPPPRLRARDAIVVMGETRPEVGGSEWAAVRHGLTGGMPPVADLGAAVALHALVRDLVVDGELAGVHDCSDGGLGVAIAEMAIAGDVGAELDLGTVPGPMLPPALVCFSESASRVVASVALDRVAGVLGRCAAAGVPAAVVGEAAGGVLEAKGVFHVTVAAAERVWRGALPERMGAVAPAATDRPAGV